MTPRTAPRLGLRAAPWLLWFGLLGGAVAWSLHTVTDWGLDETVCRSGHDSVGPIPLRGLLFVLALVFLGFSVAALAVALLQWRRLDTANRADGAADEVQALRQRRAGFMAVIGVVANILFALMLAASAIAILILPACQGSP